MKLHKSLLSLIIPILLNADAFDREFVKYVEDYVNQTSTSTMSIESIKADAAKSISSELTSDLENLQFTRNDFINDIKSSYDDAFKNYLSQYTNDTQFQSELYNLYSQKNYSALENYDMDLSLKAEATQASKSSSVGHFSSNCACAVPIQNSFEEMNTHISDNLTPVISGLQQTIAQVEANIQKLENENKTYEELLKQEKALAYELQNESHMYETLMRTHHKLGK